MSGRACHETSSPVSSAATAAGPTVRQLQQLFDGTNAMHLHNPRNAMQQQVIAGFSPLLLVVFTLQQLGFQKH